MSQISHFLSTVMNHAHTKGPRSLSSKVRVETDGQTEGNCIIFRANKVGKISLTFSETPFLEFPSSL